MVYGVLFQFSSFYHNSQVAQMFSFTILMLDLGYQLIWFFILQNADGEYNTSDLLKQHVKRAKKIRAGYVFSPLLFHCFSIFIQVSIDYQKSIRQNMSVQFRWLAGASEELLLFRLVNVFLCSTSIASCLGRNAVVNKKHIKKHEYKVLIPIGQSVVSFINGKCFFDRLQKERLRRIERYKQRLALLL